MAAMEPVGGAAVTPETAIVWAVSCEGGGGGAPVCIGIG